MPNNFTVTEYVQITTANGQVITIPKNQVSWLMSELTNYCHLDVIHKQDYKRFEKAVRNGKL